MMKLSALNALQTARLMADGTRSSLQGGAGESIQRNGHDINWFG